MTCLRTGNGYRHSTSAATLWPTPARFMSSRPYNADTHAPARRSGHRKPHKAASTPTSGFADVSDLPAR